MSPAAVPRSLAGTTIVQLAPALWDELALVQSGTRVVIAAKSAPVGEPRAFAGERLGQITQRRKARELVSPLPQN